MKNLHITFDMDGFWIVANKFLFLLFPPTILVFEFSIVMSNVFLFPWKKKVQFDVGSDSNSGVLLSKTTPLSKKSKWSSFSNSSITTNSSS